MISANQNKRPLTRIDRPRLDILRIAAAVVTGLISFSLVYDFLKNFTADEVTVIKGTNVLQPNGILYFISSAVQLSTSNYFYSIYALFNDSGGSMDFSAPKYNIDANLTCISDKKIVTINEYMTTSGFTELFTSWYPEYKQIIIEMHVSGKEVTKDTRVSLLVVKNTKAFAKLMNKFNHIICLVSLTILLFYALFALIFGRGHITVLQFLTIILLILNVVANFKYNHDTEEITSLANSMLLLTRGALFASNIFALFVASMKFANSENKGTAIIIGVIFIIAEAMCSLTTDSYVISEYFGNNGLVWVFFFSTSMISKVSLILLTIKNIIISIILAPLRRQKFYLSFYLFTIVLLTIPYIYRSANLIIKGYQNSCINFFCDYIIQAIVTFIFVQLTWPAYSKEQDDLTDMSLHHFDIQRDMSVQFETQ
jgi:hypothetical protein